jgi:hypothetical protein
MFPLYNLDNTVKIIKTSIFVAWEPYPDTKHPDLDSTKNVRILPDMDPSHCLHFICHFGVLRNITNSAVYSAGILSIFS